MNNKFTNVTKAIEFAYSKGMSCTGKSLNELNSRQLARLHITGQYLLGIRMKMFHKHTGNEVPVDREYISVSEFVLDVEKYTLMKEVTIFYFYCFTPSRSKNNIISLLPLKEVCLDEQLLEMTSQGLSNVDFHDLHDKDELLAKDIIVHKVSGQMFKLYESNVNVRSFV